MNALGASVASTSSENGNSSAIDRNELTNGSAMPRPVTKSTEKPSKPSKPRGSAGKGKGPARIQTKPCDQGNTTLDNLSSKIDKLTDIVGSVVPVVKELKRAYDEAGEPADDGEREQSSDEDEQPPTKKKKGDANEGGVVDSLVLEVTESEQTSAALPEKIASILNNILASGLNEQAATSRKEKIKRPENVKLLKVTKVNPDIWDISQEPTRSMYVRLQKMQALLIKGLIPVAKLAGLVGFGIEGTSDMPDEKSSWEDLSSSVVLIAGANHELNMCRRDLFKADLDKDYKALCNNKHPVEGELFGEDLAERLKTVKESNKASKQLTKKPQGFIKET